MRDTKPITNPAIATCKEIDSRLALLTVRLAKATRVIDQQLDKARRAQGERPSRTTTWRTTNEETRARLVMYAKDADPRDRWSIYDPATILKTLIVAEQATIEINTEMAALESEYDRRPWSRFFLVTSSHGHIHATRACSTCRPTTEFAWLPELSGETEADAVAAHGPMLCSICFPAAPVEWTRGQQRTHCTGTTPEPGTIRTWARGRFADCPHCGKTVDLKTNGEFKKHQPPKTN